MKKLYSLAIGLCLTLVCLCFLNIPAQAASVDGLAYEIKDGQVTITDCDTSLSGDLTIPATINGYPVTSIGDSAFYDCNNLYSVTIPSSVTSIGDSAFYNCSLLDGVIIPSRVTRIGDSTFYGCYNMTGITIRGRITSIGDHAFYGCYNITKITIPSSVTSIGDYAFYRCISLDGVIIPSSVTSIGEGAFAYCNYLTAIEVSANNPVYSSDACGVLYNKDQTRLIQMPGGYSGAYTIPDSVTDIGDYAFEACWNMTKITIPSSVTRIGDHAFAECTSLYNVTIGDGVTSIGSYAFYYCMRLTNITIPDSVTSIGDQAFYNCESLTSVTIGDGVTSIGDQAFAYCNRLTKITIPDSVTGIGSSAFYNCESLTSVTIGDGVTRIGDYAFGSCSSLTSVTIGDGVTSIGEGAFVSCDSLTSVTIPDSVTGIGDYAFGFCGSLTSVTIGDGVTRIGDYAFGSCGSLTSVTIGDGVTSIGDHAFYYCNRLTNITIPDSVTGIGSSAFYYCSSLTSVTIPDSVTSIGSSAFSSCIRLTSVTIGNGVTSIGSSAFSSCSLTSVTIPDSVTGIGDYAFYNCESLTSVTIPDSVTSIENRAFAYCDSLTTVHFVGDAPSFGSEVFYNVTATVYYKPGTAGWADLTSAELSSGSGVITLEETGHDWSEYTYDNNHTCTADGTQSAVCVTCGKIKSVIVKGTATGHTEVTDAAVTPTCTTTGLTEGKHCSVCGETLVAQTVVDTLLHNYIDGLCSGCGGEAPAKVTVDHSSMTLTWDVANYTKSWIHLGTSVDSLKIKASSTTGTYTITGLEADTTYYIQLSHLVGQEILSSDIMKVKTLKPLNPTKVTGLQATDIGGASFTLTWDAIEGATKYWVYVDGMAIASTTASSMTVTKRTPGTAYQLNVIACLADGTILSLADAEALTVQTLEVKYVVPTVTATSGESSITLNWNAEVCTKTWIYLGTSADSLRTNASSTDGTYTITGLKPDTTYYIRMSHCIGGTIVMSDELLTIQTAARTGLSVNAQLTGSELTLNWEENAGSYKYWVILQTGTRTLTYSTTDTCFRLSGFDFANCTVTVRGINTEGMYNYVPISLKQTL